MMRIFKLIYTLVVLCCFFSCTWVSSKKNEKISMPPVEITSERVPSGYVGDDYSTQINAKGGSGKYRFSLESMPPFLSLKKSGKLKGRLEAIPGEYHVSVSATDKTVPENQAKREYTLIIYPAVILQKKKPAPASIGSPYHEEIEIKGGSGPLEIHASGLPEGLAMDDKGVISGTPLSKPGKYRVRIDVKDKGPLGKLESRVYKLRLYPALTAIIKDFNPVLANSRFKMTIDVNGGSGDYDFLSPDLPSCLVIDSSGVVKGSVDLKRGFYNFTFNIKDNNAGVSIEKIIEMKVVDFFKDRYESMNDSGFETENVMNHTSEPQKHTFDEPGDRDVLKLHLVHVEKDSVLLLKTEKGTRPIHVTMKVYSEDFVLITEKKDEDYPQIFFKIEKPGSYYVSLETEPDETGDCSFSVSHLGQAVKLSPQGLKDVSRFLDVQQTVRANHGSGVYRFIPLAVPEKLSLSEDGTLSGRLEVEPGCYPVKIRVEDRVFQGIVDELEYSLTVFDFFPDDFERKGDNDFSTSNTMKPGESNQNHTFNVEGDEDMVRIDLSQIVEGHVIHIETLPMTRPASTGLTLYDKEKNVLAQGGETGAGKYAHIFFSKNAMDHVFLKINERNGRTGDYSLKISHKGPKVELSSFQLADALSHGPYSFQVMAEKGSGFYTFSAENLPGNLVIDTAGKISGDVELTPGLYPFQVRVTDTGYVGTGTERKYALKVVDYFPDRYEKPGDRDFETSCRLTPDDEPQKHTFHEPDDVDMIQLDLSQCKPDDVIRISIPGDSKEAELAVDFFDTSRTVISSVKRENPNDPLKIVYCCKLPGIYYIKASHLHNRPGEYSVKVDHCGPKVELMGSMLTDAESVASYSTHLKTVGGNGLYVYKIVGGELPKGLVLDEQTGQIHGKNESWGHYTVSIMANDRLFPENNHTKEYQMESFMGKKIKGTDRVEFPHYVSGVFTMDDLYVKTLIFPGRIEGGTKGNLGFSIMSHNIPADRFEIDFNSNTGELKIKEKRPVSCSQYIDMEMFADIEVMDRVCTNNKFLIRYIVPVRCLDY